MIFTTASVVSWTAFIAFFVACCLVRTEDASETYLLAAQCLQIVVLVQLISKVVFTRGLDVFASGFLITYAVVETFEILDHTSLMAELSHRLDLWIRYLFPNQSLASVWSSRQATNQILIQLIFGATGGILGTYSNRR